MASTRPRRDLFLSGALSQESGMATQDDFYEELRATFLEEARENLATMRSGLLSFEAMEDPVRAASLLKTVYRGAHSLKGSSRAVDMREIESICQALESVFQAAQNGAIHLGAGDFDTVYAGLDEVERYIDEPSGYRSPTASGVIANLAAIAAGPPPVVPEPVPTVQAQPVPVLPIPEPPVPVPARSAPVVADPASFTQVMLAHTELANPQEQFPSAAETKNQKEQGKPEGSRAHDGSQKPEGGQTSEGARHPAEGPEPGTGEQGSQEHIRIRSSRLEALLGQTEELLSIKLSLAGRKGELAELAGLLDSFRIEWKRGEADFAAAAMALTEVRGQEARRLENFIETGGELVLRMRNLATALSLGMRENERLAGTMVDDLLTEARTLLMMPFSSIAGGFQRIVRDLARSLGKEVTFDLEGGEIELEKRVLEKLKDPLVHMIRNAVDHGIETPEKRFVSGKLPKGRLTLTVERIDGGRVRIQLADDGAGLDTQAIRKAAQEHSGISGESDQAAELIFLSGVSTRKEVTVISGRGLGMAIVRDAVDALGGTIATESETGHGCLFTIEIPATSATFRGLLVNVSGHTVILPITGIERVARTRPADLLRVNGRDAYKLDGIPCGVKHMAESLSLGRKLESLPPPWLTLVIAKNRGQKVAFIVDSVLDEMEVLVKPLGTRLSRLSGILGAAVLGSGDTVPVLDPAALVASVSDSGAPRIGSVTGHGSGSVMKPSASVGKSTRDRKRNTSSSRSESHESDSGDLAEQSGAAISVLVVEDSVTSRLLLRSVLEGAGFQVTTAVDGLDGFATLKTGQFDIVVSDVEMPRLDGFGLTERIRADSALSSLPVILVTSLESREHREHGVDAGASAYIVKSGFDQSALVQTIKRLAG